MLQLSADISVLSTNQRKAVADFILNFPAAATNNIGDFVITFPKPDDELVTIPAFTTADEPEDDAAPIPEQAFTPGPALVDNDRLDKTGIPWDERIHASTRTKTADGCWKKKRNIDDATVATVEGELKALMAIPAPAPSPTPAVVSASQSASAPVIAVPTAIVSAPPPPPPPPAVAQEPTHAASPIAPVATVAVDRNAFIELITKTSVAIGAKKLTQEQLVAAVAAAGGNTPLTLPMLANRLDLVPQVAATVDAYIACAQ